MQELVGCGQDSGFYLEPNKKSLRDCRRRRETMS